MKKVGKKTIILVILCGVLLALIGAYICPFNLFFKIPCPGCGMTRAYLALLRLDVFGAFEWHPLFPIPFFVFLYIIFRDKLKALHKYEIPLTVALLVLFIATWIICLIT